MKAIVIQDFGGSEQLALREVPEPRPKSGSANLSFFASFMLGTPDFPLTDIPMQTIVDRVSSGVYLARPVKVFDFEDVAKTHALMENNLAQGKLVVRLD